MSDKIPELPSVILTTSEEMYKIKKYNDKVKILPYSYDENFQHYVLKALAANKIKYKEYYSDLLFSVDPGTKQIGIVIFLDDLFLISHTIFDKKEFLEFIIDKVDCFQKNNPYSLKLEFKFGSGVLPLTIDLLKMIYDHFGKRKCMKIFLIDESKSSKTKIKDKRKRIKTKHEVSALILALRKGIEINQSNYSKILNQFKNQELNFNGENEGISPEINESSINLKDLVEKILNNQISLSNSSETLYGNIIN
ncbi:MAG: hypothetical protein ACFFA7_02420 [Promethearchaeota archaeon]